MNVHPYVFFGGRCAEAFRYYQEHLGATDVVLLPYRGSPAESMAPPEWHDKIMHGSLKLGNTTLMGSDGSHGEPFTGMQACALALGVESAEQLEGAFAALAQGGTVRMPPAPTFFAQRFAMVTDQFGVAWMLICEAARPQ